MPEASAGQMTRSQGPGTSCNQVLDITPCQISTTKKQDIPLKPRVPEAWKLKEPIEIGKNEFMKVGKSKAEMISI